MHPAARAARNRAVGDLTREPVHEGQLALARQRRGRPRHDEAPPLERAQVGASGSCLHSAPGRWARTSGPRPRACWSTSCSASGSASIRAASSARTVAGISGSAPPSCSSGARSPRRRTGCPRRPRRTRSARRVRRPGACPRRDRVVACARAAASATCHVPGRWPQLARASASSGRAVATSSSGPSERARIASTMSSSAGSAQCRSSIATTVGVRAASALRKRGQARPISSATDPACVAQRAAGQRRAGAGRERGRDALRLGRVDRARARAARARAGSACRRRWRRCRRAGRRPRPTGPRATPSRRCPPRRPGSARGARRRRVSTRHA